MSQIQPISQTIDSILKTYEEIKVPLNQRGFEWGKEQASDFWSDVIDAVDDGKRIFLGTLVIKAKEGSNNCSIVDGQQRLTTISLLLIALREKEKKLKLRDAAKQLNDTYLGSSDIMATHYKPKLKVSSLIEDTFNEMIDLDWNGEFSIKLNNKQIKRQIKKIKPIYDFFVKEIENKKYNTKEKIQLLLDAVRNNCYFVVIKISDDLEALEIFERMNARGIELNAAELLKNHLFTQKLSEDEISSDWDEIFKNSDNDLVRLLRYFYISLKGHVTKDELYKSTKALIKEIGPKKFIEKLKKFSEHYYHFVVADRKDLQEYIKETLGKKSPIKAYVLDEICDSFEGLQLFKVSQHIPIIGAAFNKILDSDNQNEKYSELFAKLLRSLESFHFVNNLICKKANNEIEKFYAERCEIISSSLDLTNNLVDSIISGLAKRKEELGTFIDNFSELSYDPGSTTFKIIYYIFDKFNNYGKKGADRKNIYNTDLRISKKNYNIDHINPKNSDLYDYLKEEEREFIDSIGNLLVISYHANSRAQNMPIVEKVDKIYKDSELISVRDFISNFNKKDWDSKKKIFLSIEKRTRKLAEDAYRKIWFF